MPETQAIPHFAKPVPPVLRIAHRIPQDFEGDVRALFEASPVALVLTRMSDHTVTEANERAAEMFGVPLEDVRGQCAPDFWEHVADRHALLARVVREGTVDSYVAPLVRADGTRFWGDVAAQLLSFGGETSLLVGVRDITAQRALEDRLRELATVDALTGAVNRRRFFELGDEEIARADRYGGALSLAMIDADHFKRINDTFGHAAGDEALVHIASTLRAGLRRSDTVGRYGGEELALLLPATELAGARLLVDALRAAVASSPREVRVTVSAGVVERTPGESLASMLRRADAALYRAKADGRNCVRSV
jgi:diguanylate cyclase (GGDEF)-like protein/PAS domain S-box-containing protein